MMDSKKTYCNIFCTMPWNLRRGLGCYYLRRDLLRVMDMV